MNRLFIIGNGFDMFHGMKTSYSSFKNYFESHYKSDYDKFCDLYECYQDRLWCDLEKTLGELDYENDLFEKCNNYLIDDYIDDEWRDSANFDFQYEIENYLSVIDSLKINMETWIENVKYPANRLVKFDDRDTFITFNYTLTLENLYSIRSEKILHIHNKTGENIIVGHNNKSCGISLDHHNPNHFDFRIQESIKNYNSYMDKYQKHTEEIIDDNIEILTKKFNKIIVIGHSMSDIDIDYFKVISKSNKNSEWIIVYYSENDKKNYQNRINDLGILNYKLITYDELVNYLK